MNQMEHEFSGYTLNTNTHVFRLKKVTAHPSFQKDGLIDNFSVLSIPVTA